MTDRQELAQIGQRRQLSGRFGRCQLFPSTNWPETSKERPLGKRRGAH
jgi:hypothetical protein